MSYSFVGSQTQQTRVFSLLQLLPLDFRSNYVTSGSFHVSASSFEVQPCRKSKAPKTRVFGILQPLQGDSRSRRHFRVTFSHVRSHHVISSHVTASCCELQLCRKSNSPKTRVSSLLQLLPVDFRSNDVTSGSLSLHELK